jgi:hypothetical protein
MPFIADTVFDNGLSTLTTNADRMDITSTGEATTYSLATVGGTNSLGNSAVTTASPSNGATDGRRVIVGAISNGSVTNSGTAVAWALTDGASVLYATGTLSASQAVTSGNTFTLDAVSITIRDAA